MWNPALYFSESDITQTVIGVREVTQVLQAFVFYSGPTTVLQNWPEWVRNNLLDYATLMMYAYLGTSKGEHLVAYWISQYITPLNLDPKKITIFLSAADYHADNSGKTIKPVSQFQLEIDDTTGYEFGFFDSNYLSSNYLPVLKENNMSTTTDITAVIADLEAVSLQLTVNANELTVKAAALRKVLLDLETADVLADELAELL
jgi:hypothetical protein